MVERIDDMPPGTIGLLARGKLSRADYKEVLEPALKEAIDSGEVRAVCVLTDFDGLEPGAWIEEVKTGIGIEVAHRKQWKRLALVTDVERVAKAVRKFSWLLPGELETYGMEGLAQAKIWVAG